MKINLRIENLILQGIPLTAADRVELASAIQLELGRLLTLNGNSQPWESLDGEERLQAGEIRYQPGNSPIRLGQEIAASLHSSFQNNTSISQSEES